LGMNWRESSCLPKPIEMVACAFLSRLIKWKTIEKEWKLLKELL
jgi:hypothetical protein